MLICFFAAFTGNDDITPFDKAPEWSKSAIWYQIFPERFRNGDQNNNPGPNDIGIPPLGQIAPDDWHVSPWTSDWYGREGWETEEGFYDNLYYRRYGGDLQGVLDKLDYLQDLGVTALFFNPLNDAPSSHKYDARHYHHIDVNFGPDPEGDKLLIAKEEPTNPSTWQWTAADKLFLKLIKEVHRRGMRLIVDFSWNHTGVLFWAWQDVLRNQSASPYKDWYEIYSFADAGHPGQQFTYHGWTGVSSLPEIKKVDISSLRVDGQPYEGNINAGAKQHIFSVIQRWLAPDGDAANGIDGFRLDVADQIGLGFWRDFRKEVRRIKHDAYLVGEIWWNHWPDTLMDPTPYLQGDIFDGVMFYHTYRPARYFFAKTKYPISADHFKHDLEKEWNRLPQDKRYAMMNVASTHDTPRLLTDFYNTNIYKLQANPRENPGYLTGKPDEETYCRLRLYLVHQFTSIGAPHIWNGEEMGMWGCDDPDPRKPLWWADYLFDHETRTNIQPGEKSYDPVEFNQAQFNWYKKLISIRKSNPVLSGGNLQFISARGGVLSYRRYNAEDEIFIFFNLEKTVRRFVLPASGYSNLLNDDIITGKILRLNSLSAAILKKT